MCVLSVTHPRFRVEKKLILEHIPFIPNWNEYFSVKEAIHVTLKQNFLLDFSTNVFRNFCLNDSHLCNFFTIRSLSYISTLGRIENTLESM